MRKGRYLCVLTRQDQDRNNRQEQDMNKKQGPMEREVSQGKVSWRCDLSSRL